MRWRLALIVAAAGPAFPVPPVSSATYANFIKLEISLDAPSIFLVSWSHVCTVLIDHVRFEIESRREDNKLAGLALRLIARVMRMVKVLFLRDINKLREYQNTGGRPTKLS
jgi:hypothetical protein